VGNNTFAFVIFVLIHTPVATESLMLQSYPHITTAVVIVPSCPRLHIQNDILHLIETLQ